MRATQAQADDWLSRLDFLWVELTPKCNLNCVHCYAEAGPDAIDSQGMSAEAWLSVLRQAFDVGCRSVQFTGGEPTLCPDLPRLLRAARKIGFDSIELYTNGTLLNQQLRSALKKHGIDLAFSLYGSCPEVHDAVTGKQGSFAKTIDSITWALKAGLAVRVSVIKMDANAGDIRRTKVLLHRLGVRNVSEDGVRKIGRGNGSLHPSDNPADELCGYCWQGKLAVEPDGNVIPCVFARYRKLGHVSQSLTSILRSEQLHSFRKEIRNMSNPELKSTSLSGGGCTPTRLRPTEEVQSMLLPTADMAMAPSGCTPTRAEIVSPQPRRKSVRKVCTPTKKTCTPTKKSPCTPTKKSCTPTKGQPCTPTKKKPCTPTKKRACAPSTKKRKPAVKSKPARRKR